MSDYLYNLRMRGPLQKMTQNPENLIQYRHYSDYKKNVLMAKYKQKVEKNWKKLSAT